MGICKLIGKILGKQEVRTQSLVCVNDDGAYILVSFKRAGNIVECNVVTHLPRNVSGLVTSADFLGSVPTWAYPDRGFGKQQQQYTSLTGSEVEGWLAILLNDSGWFSIVYGNSDQDNDYNGIFMQFTYIVDDTDRVYQLGDVDGNGVIDVTDLKMIQSNIMGVGLTKKSKAAADMNQNGTIESADYMILKNQLGL